MPRTLVHNDFTPATELPGVRRAALVAHAGAPAGELAIIATGVGTLARVVA